MDWTQNFETRIIASDEIKDAFERIVGGKEDWWNIWEVWLVLVQQSFVAKQQILQKRSKRYSVAPQYALLTSELENLSEKSCSEETEGYLSDLGETLSSLSESFQKAVNAVGLFSQLKPDTKAAFLQQSQKKLYGVLLNLVVQEHFTLDKLFSGREQGRMTSADMSLLLFMNNHKWSVKEVYEALDCEKMTLPDFDDAKQKKTANQEIQNNLQNVIRVRHENKWRLPITSDPLMEMDYCFHCS